MTTRTTITGSFDRLEVNPDPDFGNVELGDVVYGLVKIKVASDTVKHTADEEGRTVALHVQDFAVVLEAGPLLTALKLGITSRAAGRDRAAGRPPLENDGETVDGEVEAELDEATTAALEELDELERELTGDVDPAGAEEAAPADQPGPFEDPDGDLELEDEEPHLTYPPAEEARKASALDEAVARTDAADPAGDRFLAIDGTTITGAELEDARRRVIAAFGTDYVEEPSTAVREDLLGLEHVAAWLLRDLRTVEQAAGARPEVIDYLDDRLATTLAGYADADPWPGYRSSTVETILGALERKRPEEEERGNWPELAEHVIAFEAAHKARKGVLDVVEASLETLPEAELPEPDPDFEPTEDPAGEEADG
jgi:hypothetical protein